MTRLAHIIAMMFLAAYAHAGIFSGWQEIYVSADDGKAYDFYGNGEFLCSGTRCHYTNSSGKCKIEFIAKKGERIYGITEFGDDYQWEQRPFLAKVLFDNRDEDRPCTSTSATVQIDPVAHMHFFMPPIKTNTDWARPAENKELLVPRKMPSRADWKKSPYKK